MQKPTQQLLVFKAILLLLFLNACQNEKEILFELQATGAITEGTPVFLELSPSLKEKGIHAVRNSNTDQLLAIQQMGDDKLVFLLDEALEAAASRSYRLLPKEEAPPWKLAPVILEESKKKIAIKIGQKPVLEYATTTLDPPSGSPAYYRRSGFIHPLYSPDNQVLTDGFPVGHTHQHGIFNAWVNTTFQGDKTDFWNQQQETGTVRHLRIMAKESGPVFARFTAELEHIKVKEGDTIPALIEELSVTVYHRESPFLMDIESAQRCAGADTLFLNKYHYGGMAFRGSREWNHVDSLLGGFSNSMKVITSEGIEQDSVNHTRPHWINASGQIKGQLNGLTAMGHPDNFRWPQAIRVHPTMPYFVFTPSVESGFTIVPGQVYRSAYRYLVHGGAPDIAMNDAVWESYRSVPKISFGKDR